MSSDRVRVLHLGVDTEVFRPAPEARLRVRRELGVPASSPIVTLMARFQTVKGQDVFLRAGRLIAGRVPEVRLVIAGANIFGRSGDETYRRQVLAQAAGDPVLRDHVVFSGWVDRTDRLLAASDVVVCSSRFESFGMAVVEAMSCAVPVVSTNVGGPAETVIDGETGFLVPPERPDLIAERTLQLLDDPDLRTRMGTVARAVAVERFGLRRYADGFGAALENAVGQTPPNRRQVG